MTVDRRALMMGAAGLAACSGALSDSAPTKAVSEVDSKTASAADLSGFAVNLESWYRDTAFDDRFDRAARDGFSHVEFWYVEEQERDASVLAKRARDAGVSVSQIVAGVRDLAKLSSRASCLEACQRAIDNAATLQTDIITLTGHNDIEGISAEDARATFVDHIRAAAPLFEAANMFAAIEPFNPYDHPGHFFYGSHHALEAVQAIGSPNVGLNWDLFHMQRAEGELIGNLNKGAKHIAYAQMADAPKRNEPGTGEVNWTRVIQALRASGYDRPIGLELWPMDGDDAKALTAVKRLAATL